MQIEPDDIFTRGHGRGNGARFQFKHVLDQLMFLLAQHPGQRARFHHRINIIGGDIVFTHHRDFKQAENHVGHAVEKPHHRAEQQQTETHRIDNAQRDRFRRNHPDSFGRQVGEQNKQAGHQGKRADKAQLIGQLRRNQPIEQVAKRRGESGVADDTAEDGDGVQADLHDGKEHARRFLHFQHALRVDIAFIGQQFEFDFTRGRQRYFRK